MRASHAHDLCLIIVALWLVFSKFRIARWDGLPGTVPVLTGAFVLVTFLALFNYLTAYLSFIGDFVQLQASDSASVVRMSAAICGVAVPHVAALMRAMRLQPPVVLGYSEERR
jgi:uncharacterized membrane protein YjfL (UPF0719 family)